MSRMNVFFVPGAGIDREVITTDICRYLGPDATVKPGSYKDPNPRRDGTEAREEKGFFVTAYRSLTTSQIADLKADSARWLNERAKSGLSRNSGDGYSRSVTRANQAQSSYGSNASPYGSQHPLGMPQPQYDNGGRQVPQPPGYGGPHDFNPNQGSYIYGDTVRYEPANGRGMQQNPPRTSYTAPASTGYSQGRGMDMGYQPSTGYPPLNNMAPSPYYDQSTGIGRTQPMATPQNYAPTNQQYNEQQYGSYRVSTGLAQQDDTPMDDSAYDDQYQDSTAPLSSMAPQQMQPQREREREQPSRRRERNRDQEREHESRHKDKHRR